ncbi:MAG: acetyltransferase [Planctomycetes bacterium]|nr:acetyltransferase [Planctomycetota bacterium]
MTDVVIYGASGLGRLAYDTLLQGGKYRTVGFLDSDTTKHGHEVDGLPVFGGLEQLERLLKQGVTGGLVAIGDNRTRVRIAEQLRAAGVTLVSAIHPLSSISPSAQVGEHVILAARVTICVHAVIGPHCVLSAGTIVEHDNVLGSGVFLHPAVRLAGTVTVEDYATIGIGAAVIPGRRIRSGAHVEPGAVVITDVPPNTIIGGVPARCSLQPDAKATTMASHPLTPAARLLANTK